MDAISGGIHPLIESFGGHTVIYLRRSLSSLKNQLVFVRLRFLRGCTSSDPDNHQRASRWRRHDRKGVREDFRRSPELAKRDLNVHARDGKAEQGYGARGLVGWCAGLMPMMIVVS